VLVALLGTALLFFAFQYPFVRLANPLLDLSGGLVLWLGALLLGAMALWDQARSSA
jgi:hypothetical protein